jgi:hypothetical protein
VAAPPAVAEIRVQLRAEDFEAHHRGERLKLVANVAQPLKPFIHVEQSGVLATPASRCSQGN